jgi:hypothetical protein
MNAKKEFVMSLLVLMTFSSSLFATGIVIVPRDESVTRGPVFIPFSAYMESSVITYKSISSYIGVTAEILDANGAVVEMQTCNVTANTPYTISVAGLSANISGRNFTRNLSITTDAFC